MGTKKKERLAAFARALGAVVTSALSLGALIIPGVDLAHAGPATGSGAAGGTGDPQRTVSIGGIASSGPGSIAAPGGSGVKTMPSARQSAAGKEVGTATPAAPKAAAGVKPVVSAGMTVPAQAKTSAKAAATSASITAAQTTSGNRPAATAKDKLAEATGELTAVKNVYSPSSFVAPSTFTVNYICHNTVEAVTKETTLTLTSGTPARVIDIPGGICTVTGQDASAPNAYWHYGIVASTSPAPPPPGGRSPQSTPQAGQSNKAQQPTDLVIITNRPVGVRVNNLYRLYNSIVSISKEVLGDKAKFAPATFEYEYSCTDNDGKVLPSGTVRAEPGKEAKIDKFGGGRCKMTEKDASVTGATLTVEMSQARECQGSLLGQSPRNHLVSVVKTTSSAVARGAPTSKAVSRASSTRKAAVNVTIRSIDFDLPRGPMPCEIKVKMKSTYTMDYASSSMAEKIETPADVDLPMKKFVLGYTCKPTKEDKAKGKMEVPGDGTTTPLSKQLPVGALYTVIEGETSMQSGDYKVKIAEPQIFTLEERDAVKALIFTNAHTKPTPSPAPSLPETPSPSETPTPTPPATSAPSITATPSMTPSTTPSKPVADLSKPVSPMLGAGRPVLPNTTKPMAPKVEQKAANRDRSLPNTGVSVAGMAAVALITAAGDVLILRRKKARPSRESRGRKATALGTAPVKPVERPGA